MSSIKFEHIFAIILLIILSIALFVFRDDKDLVMIFATAIVGSFASVTTFFFTKYTPKNQSFISNTPYPPISKSNNNNNNNSNSSNNNSNNDNYN